jgi:diaminopimelate epimerase
MRIWNSDGGEVEACGNAARCVSVLVGGNPAIETKGGIVRGSSEGNEATVDMGKPRFAWDEIPLAYPMDTRELPVAWENLRGPCAVNVGNPHVIFFVDDLSTVDLEHIGPVIERDPLFPEGINVNVAEIGPGSAVTLRVWERGSGLTLACGTGACATAVAGIRYRGLSSPADVTLPGGKLSITWAPGEPIRMAGSATYVFSGELPS